MNNNEPDEFDYKTQLENLIKEHYPPLDGARDAREALLAAFFTKMVEFANSNVLATSLHAFRMFFATLGMSDVEDLILDIIRKEKLILGNNDFFANSATTAAYTEDEIARLQKKAEE
ncbi:hypothetical protein [Borrelia sp. RT5S]|uniref:hypothetical protein n=1 Tax=Borrelia sp. RT5S TaxID=2898581 RepID=UPI001E29253F|nr:hypothetical protein [Borrelia sp. RT5S]UGQ16713.1 hypothetical protein LSO06_05180 [Borrelia sp. RT5S]